MALDYVVEETDAETKEKIDKAMKEFQEHFRLEWEGEKLCVSYNDAVKEITIDPKGDEIGEIGLRAGSHDKARISQVAYPPGYTGVPARVRAITPNYNYEIYLA